MYQYNGKELVEDNGLGWNHYGARAYDAAVGRFWNTDRFAEKFGFQTSFAYGANNPIKFIDVNGDSTDVFTPDGSHLYTYDDGKNENTGFYFSKENRGKDGRKSYSDGIHFNYNDEESDRPLALNGEYKFHLVSDDEINGVVSARIDEKNKKGQTDYEAGLVGGAFDFFSNTDTESPAISGTLHIAKGSLGTTALNPHDYGNYLTGQAYGRLGYSVRVIQIGAHANNIKNGPTQHGDRSASGWLDSKADQQAIWNGYHHFPREIKRFPSSPNGF